MAQIYVSSKPTPEQLEFLKTFGFDLNVKVETFELKLRSFDGTTIVLAKGEISAETKGLAIKDYMIIANEIMPVGLTEIHKFNECIERWELHKQPIKIENYMNKTLFNTIELIGNRGTCVFRAEVKVSGNQ
jgi:hypothetical protein